LRNSDVFVQAAQLQMPARLVANRPRSRILRLADGQYAKIVKGSHVAQTVPSPEPCSQMRWLKRNRRSWEHLRHQTHPGLLRVGERVTDNHGDEGYVCQGLDVFDLDDPTHPARRSLASFLDCALQLARASGVMHDAGFVHGDITPANVCFFEGRPVLIDYEMTVEIGHYISLQPNASGQHSICCTPDCCSPEHILRERVTPSCDVYCIGLTLLSWLSERFGVELAYLGQSPWQSMGLCARAQYPHWREVESRLQSQDVLDVLTRCIQVVPVDRYKDGNALADAITAARASLCTSELEQALDAPIACMSQSSRSLSTFFNLL
jgi:serine/threonine protein kinase